ncbi:hypothetical protein FF1_005872 [Malus domestica]
MKDHRINGVRRMMGFTNGFKVPPMGRVGSLSLWWEDSIEVNILFSSKHVIDAQVKSCEIQQWVRVTGIYRTAYRGEKAEFWGWMNDHFTSSDMPWLCGGGISMNLFGIMKNRAELMARNEEWRTSGGTSRPRSDKQEMAGSLAKFHCYSRDSSGV